jgi:hypothetical protein
MLNASMPEELLQGAGVGALVGQIVAAAVSQHVRMDRKL